MSLTNVHKLFFSHALFQQSFESCRHNRKIVGKGVASNIAIVIHILSGETIRSLQGWLQYLGNRKSG